MYASIRIRVAIKQVRAKGEKIGHQMRGAEDVGRAGQKESGPVLTEVQGRD